VHSKEDSNGSSLDNNFTILEIAICVFRGNLIWIANFYDTICGYNEARAKNKVTTMIYKIH
jgi:hypothetical protein